MTRLAVPPGLTCYRCALPFQRALARPSSLGWAHAAPCPFPTSPPVLTSGTWVHRGGIGRWQPGGS